MKPSRRRSNDARAQLAARVGILPESIDAAGRARPVDEAVRDALLDALGHDVSSESAVAAELARFAAQDRERIVAPVGVRRDGERDARRLVLHVDAGAPVEWSVEVVTEDGRVLRRGGRAQSHGHELVVALPSLPLGVHQLIVRVKRGPNERFDMQTLIVAPRACFAFRGRAFGIWSHLYAARGRRDLGIGDVGTLRELIDFAAANGADFVGVNPLHSIRATNAECSPYSPISRLYRSPTYLDVRAIPELADRPDVRARLEREEKAAARRPSVDYDRVRVLKRRLLRLLHEQFRKRHLGRATARGRAFERYCRDEGETLKDHAMYVGWCGIAADYDLELWLQFELDRQLFVAQAAARRAGLALGVYGDLAIGSIATGSDVIANRELFVTGASLGAPPDSFSRDGQVWNLPPLHPLRSRATGHEYFRRLLRAAFRHVGLLRLDHVIGLVRQWWVPAGFRGAHGAFVRMPADELFACVALESHRARACVVGEDLGSVPPGLEERLRKERILSSSVLLFERDAHGFKPSRRYREEALATANTHDLPPLAGYVAGAELPALARLGLVKGKAALARARAARRADVAALIARLRAERLLPPSGVPSVRDLVDAVYRLLAKSPARLVGVALDDLTLEKEPLNVPTATPDRFPVWQRRSSQTIGELARDPSVTALLRQLNRSLDRRR